ncbi:MAG: hypothetical protein AAGA64_07105 [Bacteroidota bacterium]
MKLAETSSNRIVAYLDVLGFKDMIMKDDNEKLQQYFDIVRETLNSINGEENEIQSLLISDSVILSTELTETKFKQLAEVICFIQAKLALKNIWLRGAISFGDINFDVENKLVVGKGLINAFLLENAAKYPRVIIDPRILKAFDYNRR